MNRHMSMTDVVPASSALGVAVQRRRLGDLGRERPVGGVDVGREPVPQRHRLGGAPQQPRVEVAVVEAGDDGVAGGVDAPRRRRPGVGVELRDRRPRPRSSVAVDQHRSGVEHPPGTGHGQHDAAADEGGHRPPKPPFNSSSTRRRTVHGAETVSRGDSRSTTSPRQISKSAQGKCAAHSRSRRSNWSSPGTRRPGRRCREQGAGARRGSRPHCRLPALERERYTARMVRPNASADGATRSSSELVEQVRRDAVDSTVVRHLLHLTEDPNAGDPNPFPHGPDSTAAPPYAGILGPVRRTQAGRGLEEVGRRRCGPGPRPDPSTAGGGTAPGAPASSTGRQELRPRRDPGTAPKRPRVHSGPCPVAIRSSSHSSRWPTCWGPRSSPPRG